MKKVLFVATVDSHIELFHLPYLKYFKENGYEVHVATDSLKEIEYCDKKIKLPIKRSPYSLSNLKATRILRGILNNEKYDIIHCHTPMGSVVTRFAAKKARKTGTKVIYTAHGFHFYKGAPIKNWFLFYPIEKLLSKHTDTLITINKEDYELAKKKFKTNIEYVKGVGLDKEKFKYTLTEEEKKDLRISLGLKEKDFVMIYPAELNKNKNQLFLINTMTKLDKNIHLILPGRDSYKGKYQKLVNKLNLENRVHFLGFRNDIQKLLQIADLEISSSKREGLPINLIEAMYMKLPVIATVNRGHKELIKNDINGYLIEQDNMEDLIDKINFLFKNKKFKNNLGFNSTKLIDDYMLENVIMDMKKIY